MHRHNGSGHETKPLEPGQCAMRGVPSDFELALLSFTISAAVPVAAQVLDVPDVADLVAAGPVLLSSRSAHPDSPPPRG
jgi:hypothetical protein